MANKQKVGDAAEVAKAIRGLTDQKDTIDTGVLLASVVQQFGGPEAIAAEMVAEYRSSKAGGLPRQKFWQMIQSLIINATNNNMTKVINPQELATDELEDMLSGIVDTAREIGDAGVPTSAEPGPSVPPEWPQFDQATS